MNAIELTPAEKSKLNELVCELLKKRDAGKTYDDFLVKMTFIAECVKLLTKDISTSSR